MRSYSRLKKCRVILVASSPNEIESEIHNASHCGVLFSLKNFKISKTVPECGVRFYKMLLGDGSRFTFTYATIKMKPTCCFMFPILIITADGKQRL